MPRCRIGINTLINFTKYFQKVYLNYLKYYCIYDFLILKTYSHTLKCLTKIELRFYSKYTQSFKSKTFYKTTK